MASFGKCFFVPNTMSKAAKVEPIVDTFSKRAATMGLGLLQRWWLMSFVLLGCGVASGTLGVFLMLRQPPKPECSQVFWPFASGSLRLYCAQEGAQKRTLEDLFQAIALVDGLSQNHPLRPLINRWVEIWSKQALDLAEEEFDRGNLERAIYFAEKIPAQTTAHALVEQRIKTWQTVWAKGDGIFKQAEAALKDENWRGAFAIMVGLLAVDNRYWSFNQYEALNRRIIMAQKDETQLVQAQRLLEAGGLDNLTKALSLVQDLSEDSIFQKSIRKTVSKISRALVSVAEQALNRKDLDVALNALQQIPREVSFRKEVEDWIEIAQAMSSAWSQTAEGYESAIAQLKRVGPDRPLYSKMQDYILKWSADISYAHVLEAAQNQAANGSVEDLSTAIDQARQVPPDSTQWKDAQKAIGEWSSNLSNQQDQPILNRADEISAMGDPASLRAAIQQAKRIPSGSPLYAEAQQRIQDWQMQLGLSTDRPAASAVQPKATAKVEPATDNSADQASDSLLQEAKNLAQKDTPTALVSAIETANQIPVRSPLRAEAQQVMNDWGNQMLALAARQATIDPNEAIAIAQQIPSFCTAYDAAQKQIQAWQTPTPRKPATQKSFNKP
jgi:uncharacterized protein (UPF0147 family)